MKNCPTCLALYPAGTPVCPKDGTPLPEDHLWENGSVIREKYCILQQVGLGGMATVYKAEHIHFHEIYALKVINADLTNNEAFVERFLREAVLTRKLKHPNAVRVDDIDTAEDGRPFMVMEFLKGQTLHEVMHFEGPLPHAKVRLIGIQVASALQAAHELGIIHRDIKPANITIMKTDSGDVAKVLDFGIAKLKEAKIDHAFENDFTLTSAGMLVGTPAYMSPEQAVGKRGSEIDNRSDLYSFAVVVYQMLTGHLPVHAETEEQYVVAHATAEPEPIQNYLPDLTPDIAHLIMSCLAKEPEDRPPDARTIIEVLKQWQTPNGFSRPAAPAKPKQAQRQATPLPIPSPAANKFTQGPSRWALLALAASLVLFFAALGYFLRYRDVPENQGEVNKPQIIASSLQMPSGDMILVPAGAALQGERNQSVTLGPFYIDKTEVSVGAYLEFCKQTHRAEPPDISPADSDLPVRNVDFTDAKAFAAWAHKRLPTASEWEKAARGTQGQRYPWGNDLGSGMARLPLTAEDYTENSQRQAVPSPVHSFPQGASSYGALNMMGNVWEWVADPVQIRGGSYQSYAPQLNLSFESLLFAGQAVPPDTKRPDIGFRCAR